jgi:predicted house-cleaning noncanonical NTP pyrophosphatase (MazG superfamily)
MCINNEVGEEISEILRDSNIEKLLIDGENNVMDIVDSSDAWISGLSKKVIAKAIVKEFLSYVEPKLREYFERELIPGVVSLLRSKGLENIAESMEFWDRVADWITGFCEAFGEALIEEWLPDVAYLAGEYLEDYITSILEESIAKVLR